MLAVLRERNDESGVSGVFTMFNVGSTPSVGTLYTDANPGALSKPVRFVYEQKRPPVYLRGEPPASTYAYFELAVDKDDRVGIGQTGRPVFAAIA